MRHTIVIAWAACSMPACKASSKEPPPPDNKAPAASVEIPKSGSGEDLTERMRHCPVTLAGVHTDLEDVDGGIRFTRTRPT
jgi:hypothetical protein